MPYHVDKFAIAGGLMCGIADLFAISSLSTPSWIVTEFFGSVRFGLTVLCQESLGQDVICERPNLPPAWRATLVFVVFGVLLLTLTCLLIMFSPWKPRAIVYSKWIAIVSLINLSLAAIIFPVGFESPEVGGTPFKLPKNTSLGSSYVSFIVAIVFTFLGELCMRKSHPSDF